MRSAPHNEWFPHHSAAYPSIHPLLGVWAHRYLGPSLSGPTGTRESQSQFTIPLNFFVSISVSIRDWHFQSLDLDLDKGSRGW